MAMAPATVLVTGGWLRSGMFSLKKREDGGGTGTPSIWLRPGGLIKDGTRAAKNVPSSGRKLGLRRAMSVTVPPGTLGTPARMSGSTRSEEHTSELQSHS